MNKSRGFTVVEVVIVCVVIGILASIVIVGYSGLQSSSRDDLRTQKMKEWASILTNYKTKYGLYPLPDDPTPVTTGTYYCLDETNSDTACDISSVIDASGSTTLFDNVRKVGQLPASNFPMINDTVSGPLLYIQYASSTGEITEFTISGVFESNECADRDLETNPYTVTNPTTEPYICDLVL